MKNPNDSVAASEALPRGDCSAFEYVPLRRERIGWRLFPSRHCDMPDLPKLKTGGQTATRDCLVAHTKVELSFLDRLRVLVSGRIEVVAKTVTENVIGENVTVAVFNVRPPGWLDRPNDQGHQ